MFLSIFSGGVTFVEVMFFMGSSLIGSFGVSKTISFFVKKYNRPSIVLISLVGVIGVSLIVMPIFGVYKSLENPEEMLSFGNVCWGRVSERDGICEIVDCEIKSANIY